MKNDMTPNRPAARTILLRGAATLFILLTCLRAWVGPFPVLSEAQAQIPDAGL